MAEHALDAGARRLDGFVRFGGAALIAAFVIHILVNMVMKRFPPESPTLAELRSYLEAEAGTWAIVHGLRYVAFAGIAIFGAALFARIRSEGDATATGWGVLGLLGTGLLAANGIITNGIETLVFLDFERLSNDPSLFWGFFHLTRVLFTAEIAVWGILIAGFSVAAWVVSALPRWLSVSGIVSAVLCLASGVFIGSIMNDGAAVILIEIASILGLLWFLITGVVLVLRGAGARATA